MALLHLHLSAYSLQNMQVKFLSSIATRDVGLTKAEYAHAVSGLQTTGSLKTNDTVCGENLVAREVESKSLVWSVES